LFTFIFVALLAPSAALAQLIQITDAIYLGSGFQAKNTHFEQGKPYRLASPRKLYEEAWEDIYNFYAGGIVNADEWTHFEDHLIRHRENWHKSGEYVLKLKAVEILFWGLVADDGETYGSYKKGRFVFGDITLDKEVAGSESRFIFDEQEVLDHFVDQSSWGSELSLDYISTEGDAYLDGSWGFFETQYHIDIFRKSYSVNEPAHMVWMLLVGLLLLIFRKHSVKVEEYR